MFCFTNAAGEEFGKLKDAHLMRSMSQSCKVFNIVQVAIAMKRQPCKFVSEGIERYNL